MAKLRIFSVLMILIFCQSCRSAPVVPPDLGDGGLISDQPCAAPCFFGVTPGVTNKEETINDLKKNNIFSGCEFDKAGMNCLGYVMDIDKSTSIVETISFQPSESVTALQILEKFGDPDLWVVEVLDRDVLPQTLWLTIIYNPFQMSMSFESQKNNNGQYELSTSSKIEHVTYYSEETYHYSGNVPWLGYGIYTEQ